MNILDATKFAKALPAAATKKEPAQFGIRPEHLSLAPAGKAKISGTVRHLEHLGENALAYVSLEDGAELVAKLEDGALPENGQPIHFTFDNSRLHLFDADGVCIA